MRKFLSKFLLAFLAFTAGINAGLASPAASSTIVRFSLDHAVDGAAAPFLFAASRGLYRAENLSVVIDAATGSQDAIARVAAGTSDIALADINALVRYRDGDGPAVKAVFVLFNKSPYAIIARRSRGIKTIPDIQGKTIGLVEGDAAARLWPSIVKQNGLSLAGVRSEKISAAVREPLLSAGQLDAVSGFSYLSAVNLRDRGVPASDLVVLRYSDFGSKTYGHALVVNPAFAAERPEAVKGFLRAIVAAVKVTIKEPAKAVDAVLPQMTGGSRELELERLRTVIDDIIVTDEVRQNGIGALDPKRFEESVAEIGEGYEFRKRPSIADIYDDGYLPPASSRKIN